MKKIIIPIHTISLATTNLVRPLTLLAIAFLLLLLHLNIQAGSAPNKNLIIEMGYEPYGLLFDPNLSSAASHVFVARQIFEPLVTIDKDGKPHPAAASQWQYSDDGLTFEIELSKDSRWSDGAAVLAEHYANGFRRLASAEAEESNNFSTVKNWRAHVEGDNSKPLGIRVTGKSTFQLLLDIPFSIRMTFLSGSNIYPIRDAGLGPDKIWAKSPPFLSTGAYQVSAINDSGFTLVKNPYYKKFDNIYYEKATIRYVNRADGIRAFLENRIDVFLGSISDQINWLSANMPEALHPFSAPRIHRISVNPQSTHLQDYNIRQALYLALDQSALARVGKRPNGIHLYSSIPNGLEGYYVDAPVIEKRKNYSSNLKAAKSIMRSRGYSNSNRLKLNYYMWASKTDLANINMIKNIQKAWRQIYVDIEIVYERYSPSAKAFKEGHADLLLDTFVSDQWLVYQYGELIYSLKEIGQSDPEYQKLITNISRSSNDHKLYLQHVAALDRYNQKNLHNIPLFVSERSILVSAKIDTSATRKQPFSKLPLELLKPNQ